MFMNFACSVFVIGQMILRNGQVDGLSRTEFLPLTTCKFLSIIVE